MRNINEFNHFRAVGLVLLSCSAASVPVTDAPTFGATYAGSYHLGPVDWQQSQWTNSCGPYPQSIQSLEGSMLAGVDVSLNGNGSLCDACALVTTRVGKTVLVRIITTGTSNAAGDMDLSPAAYDFIHQDDPQGTSANPRPMTWQLARCPSDVGPLRLQYQTEANTYWTSLWVRAGVLPIASVEVQSSRHPEFTALKRGNDGTWTDSKGFGSGAFTLRITAMGGQVVTERFDAFTPGAVVTMSAQFQ